MSRTSKDTAQLGIFIPRGKRKSLADRFAAWRATTDGHEVAAAVATIALDLAAAGAGRIALNALFEQLRAARKKSLNNSYRSFLARELVDRYPQLKDRIELRSLTSKKGRP